MSDSTAAVLVVQTFLDAYNASDLEGFIAQLDDDVIAEDDSSPTLQGAEAMRAWCAPLFVRDQAQKSTLLGRMVMGRYVLDMEYVTGRGAQPIRVMALYRVENGKITYMRLLRETVSADPFAQNSPE